MRKCITLLLVICLVAMPFTAFAADDTAAQGSIDGALAGNEVNASYFGPFMWGCFLNIIGVGVSYGMATANSPTIDPITLSRLDRHNTEYQDAFIAAYKKAAKDKIVRTALVGSVAGAALQTLAMLAGTSEKVEYNLYSTSW